jgi:transcription elongation factor Elf1
MTKPTDQKKRPGFPCPECNSKIEISLKNIISDGPIKCNNCGLKITLSKTESKSVLDSLNTIKKLK